MSRLTTHRGGCHCGRVRFEFDALSVLDAVVCNCSICSMSGFEHYFVARSRFRLLSGADELATYRFGTRVAEHLFCRHCGIKSFYVPRSHPDAWSVNVNCIDDTNVKSVRKTAFDGRRWEQNISELSPISD